MRKTFRISMKVWYSDPIIQSEMVIDQRIKGTLGITG